MQYKNFVLDGFQEDAIKCIEKNSTVIVSAATGTGKTLIADYVIDKFIKENKRVIYTAPIKALSNQKYRDFKKEYGDKIGILTGDVSINGGAQVLIMTTEIYRNMLLSNDPITEGLSYVIFDEIHFLSDFERGTIWEESIIFSPPHVRFLCLSATIPNSKQFASWIESIKEHKVEVIRYDKRAVPLEHSLFDQELGVVKAQEVEKRKEYDRHNDYYRVTGQRREKGKKNKMPSIPPNHVDLIKILRRENKLPCIFFVFSRLGTEKKAKDLVREMDFINNEEKARSIEFFNRKITDEIRGMESTMLLKRAITKGVGIHHAGLLPIQKEVVEELFGMGLIKVLYATETFAVGINYPARTVCFNSLDKFDGRNFRYMNSKEYFQMAGRAGRRGIDTVGYAIAMVDRHYTDMDKVIRITSKDVDPIISQFKLSINTVINMIKNHSDLEIEIILRSNFDFFLRKNKGSRINIKNEYLAKVRDLKTKGYIIDSKADGRSYALTEKGNFTSHIYSNEMLVTELFFGDLYKNLSEAEIVLIIASIVYEYRPSHGLQDPSDKNDKHQVNQLLNKIRINNFVAKELNVKNFLNLFNVVKEWCGGCEFAELMELSDLLEGDYIRLFRQITDILSQIRRATNDLEEEDKISKVMNMVYRDVVKVEFD